MGFKLWLSIWESHPPVPRPAPLQPIISQASRIGWLEEDRTAGNSHWGTNARSFQILGLHQTSPALMANIKLLDLGLSPKSGNCSLVMPPKSGTPEFGNKCHLQDYFRLSSLATATAGPVRGTCIGPRTHWDCSLRLQSYTHLPGSQFN